MGSYKTNSGCGTTIFGGVWILFWSVIVLIFDGVLVGTTVQQLWALSWPDAPGVVLTSKVAIKRDGDGTSHKAEISYEYTAAGGRRTGNTINHGSIDFGSYDAHALVRDFPAGKQIHVYYNRDSPDQSMLRPGITTGHAFLVMFLVPFNVVMLGGWLVAWDYLDRRTNNVLPRGASLVRTYEGFQLKLYGMTPLAAAAVTAGAISFVGIFVAGFGQMVLPAKWLVLGAWSVVVPASVYAWFRQRGQATRLEVNELRNTVTIHTRHAAQKEAKRPSATFLLDAVADVETRSKTKLGSDGDSTQTYSVSLVEKRKDGSRKRRMLIAGWSEKQANRLAGWLREHLAPGAKLANFEYNAAPSRKS
jgi:hypothetical protein